MKKTIKFCLLVVTSLIQFEVCAEDKLLIEEQKILCEELIEYINKDTVTKDPIFYFDPDRWGIVQGRVPDTVAEKNKKILNNVMFELKQMGVSVMEIGPMDAYFKVDLNNTSRKKNADASIQIPTNFHLKMGNDTYIRVQPNGKATYTLMTMYSVGNSKISGGHLVGDRYEHDYSPIVDEAGIDRNSHEWGHLIWIIGSNNIEVNNVNLSKSTGDGIVFHSKSLRNPDGTLQADNREVKNVLIKNTTITDCRRNSISVLDGRYITIDNCIITNTGQGEQVYDASGSKIASSAGTAPRYGIDLESIRTRNDDGSLNQTALINNIIIKNSRFTGNEAGDIVVYTANDVLIENNYFDKWVGSYASYNVTINNNLFESRDPSFFAVSVQSFITDFGEELNHHYLVSNNTIKNYGVGVKAAGRDQTVSNNKIIDCTTGVLLINNLTNGTFNGNSIISSLDVSFGYKNLYNCKNLYNVKISNETIKVRNRPVSFNKMLIDSNINDTQVTFRNCNFYTANLYFDLLIKATKNIMFDGNTSNTDYLVVDSENIILTNNFVE